MIINLTPHDITITNGTRTLTIKPSGLARCEETSEEIKVVEDWIPVFRTTYGKISGLPEPKENTIYVVSARVAQALKETNPERTDVMIPAKTLRDSEGNIIGCTGLSIVQDLQEILKMFRFPFFSKTKKFTETSEVTSVEIASFVVNYCASENKFINMTKLQKLVYCLYGAYLAYYDKPICSDKPKIWNHGPSFSLVYDESMKMSWSPIDGFLNYFLNIEDDFYKHFNDSEVKFMCSILKFMCEYSSKTLVNWSMSEGSPWKRDLDTGSRMHDEMTDSYIKEFFKTKFLKTKRNKEETV